MRIIARSTLRDYWQANRRAEPSLKAWFKLVEASEWSGPADVRAMFRSADFVGDRIVFNIGGNSYRLIVGVAYRARIVFVKWVGTHAAYDNINVEEV